MISRRGFPSTVFLIILAVGLLNPSPTYADDLRKVLKSQDLVDISNKNITSALQPATRWLKPGSNHKLLFSESWPKFLSEWLSADTYPYEMKYQSHVGEREYNHLRQVYQHPTGAKFFFNIFVPHPKFQDLIDYGLVQALAQVAPPGLKVTRVEDLEVNKIPAQLYFMRDQPGCRLTLELKKNLIATFRTKSCDNKERLVELANKINFVRLNALLESK